MDCNYKTSTTKLPLLNVVARTNKSRTIPMGFRLRNGETKQTFGRALYYLNQLTNSAIERKTNVVLTDRELALINAFEGEMPYASNVICI